MPVKEERRSRILLAGGARTKMKKKERKRALLADWTLPFIPHHLMAAVPVR